MCYHDHQRSFAHGVSVEIFAHPGRMAQNDNAHEGVEITSRTRFVRIEKAHNWIGCSFTAELGEAPKEVR